MSDIDEIIEELAFSYYHRNCKDSSCAAGAVYWEYRTKLLELTLSCLPPKNNNKMMTNLKKDVINGITTPEEEATFLLKFSFNQAIQESSDNIRKAFNDTPIEQKAGSK